MSDTNRSLRHDQPASIHGGLMPAATANVQAPRMRSGSRPPAPADQGITPAFVLTALRRWWMIALPVSLISAAASGAAVYLLFEPVYEAAAWFRIEEHTPFLAFESKDDARSKLFFQTQIETIRSPLVLGPVLKQKEVVRLPEIARRPDKVAWLARQIKVTSVGESELFRILYAGPDATGAAKVVNAVTEAYFKLRDESDAERNRRVIELLNQEIDKRSKEVARLRDNLRTLAKEVTGIDPFAGKTEVETPQKHPLAEVESRMIAAQVERAVLDARIRAAEEVVAADKTDESGKDPAEATVDNKAEKRQLTAPEDIALRDAMADGLIEQSSEVQKQQALVTAKQSRMKEIEDISAKGKNDSTYTLLAKEVDGDQKELERIRGDIKSRIRHEAELTIAAKRAEMESARAAKKSEDLAKLHSDRETQRVLEQILRDRYDEQRKNLEHNSGNTLELSFKRDELARAEKVFELIAQRALQLQTERGAPARVTLMQAAEPPSAPVELFPYRNIAMAVLAAFCLPFALVVFWERLAGRVADSKSFEQQSTVTVLGEVTRLPLRRSARQRTAGENAGYEIRLFEESIDSLRTSLSLSDELAAMRMLAITSAANHEGKTSVAAQLAVSFARATGKPLLLIDGDMRSPDVHNVFEIPLEPGLAGVLSGQCRLEDAIVTSWSDHVHLLPAGRLACSPHKLLGNGTWKSLLAQIPADYRYVVIDTPPVLAAAESLVLAKGADATLVCMMRDVSRLDQVRKAVDRLAAAGSRPIGTVLNGVTARQYAHRYGHYSYVAKL